MNKISSLRPFCFLGELKHMVSNKSDVAALALRFFSNTSQYFRWGNNKFSAVPSQSPGLHPYLLTERVFPRNCVAAVAEPKSQLPISPQASFLRRHMGDYLLRNGMEVTYEDPPGDGIVIEGYLSGPDGEEVRRLLKEEGFRFKVRIDGSKVWVGPNKEQWIGEEKKSALENEIRRLNGILETKAKPRILPSLGEGGIFELKVNQFLHLNREELTRLLPPAVDVTKFLARLRAALLENKKVLEKSNQGSWLIACKKCAQWSLTPGPNNFVYFTMRSGQVEALLGYQGDLHLARNAYPDIEVTVNIVREGDDFEIEQGSNPKITHVRKAQSGAPVQYAYAIVRFSNGREVNDYMTIEDIEKVKGCSTAPKNAHAPWIKFEEEMIKKSMFRKVLKYFPKVQETDLYVKLGKSLKAFSDAINRLPEDIREEVLDVKREKDSQKNLKIK